jgi:dsDNA-specific endonuclease/ATPase MutS2
VGRFKARRGGKAGQPPRSIREIGPGEGDGGRPGRPPDMPVINLRKCPLEEAVRRLDRQVPLYARQGRPEVLVIHGKGLGSPDGRGVLGEAVRDWCLAHPRLVREWRLAPPSWGGEGVTILTLAPASGEGVATRGNP